MSSPELIVGGWGYVTGTNGTPTIPTGARIQTISCVAGGTAGTVTIGSGAAITVPASTSWSDVLPEDKLTMGAGLLASSGIVFSSNIANYYVSYIAG